MPGLGDAHTHLTWNGGDLNRLGDLPVEEHVLLTARSAQCYIDSGYTMQVFSYVEVYLVLTSSPGALEPPRLKSDSM